MWMVEWNWLPMHIELFIVYIHGEGHHQKSHKCVNPHTEILLYRFSSIWVYFTSITTSSWMHEAVVSGYMLWHEIGMSLCVPCMTSQQKHLLVKHLPNSFTDKRDNYPGAMLVWVYEPGWRGNRSIENRRIYCKSLVYRVQVLALGQYLIFQYIATYSRYILIVFTQYRNYWMHCWVLILHIHV